jgi:hypothetical protein
MVRSPLSGESLSGEIMPPTVPGYTLQTLLGRGGSGEVWQAVPRGGGPAVAVKVLVAGDPERQAREAALLGELDHPHLVRLHELVNQPCRGGAPRVALVLDLLAGGSLAALLARRGRLRPGEVVTAIAPVAAALAHAHEHGVVHGDLSPGNIVFTADGRPVLTDLGVARVLGEVGEGQVTPAYVDPTVARGGAHGPSSDVFGVAAAAFHALTGVPPWNGARPADALDVAAHGELPDLAELAPEAPAQLRAVIARGLAADPHDRGTAAAFALDLRHACRPEPVRLSTTDAPDGDLGRTTDGPRTELTHQVPGRRPRPAPVVVPPPPSAVQRWFLRPWYRPTVDVTSVRPRRVAAVVLLVVVIGLAVWLGASWSRLPAPGSRPVVADMSVAADGSTPSEPAHENAVTPGVSAVPAEGGVRGAPSGGPSVTTPTSAAEWLALINGIYALRAEAFTSGMTEPLADVYAEGSPLRPADEQQVSALRSAGEVLRGFEPAVIRVEAMHGSGERREIRLVDRWPAYQVVPAGDPDGPALRHEPARGEVVVGMVLVRTTRGWRIDTAERSG